MKVSVAAEAFVPEATERIWPFLVEIESELRWRRPYIVQLAQLTDGPVGVGTRFAGTTRILGRTETYATEVTVFEPPVRYAWRGMDASGSIIGVGSYEVTEVSGGARVRLAMQYTPTSFGGMVQLPIVQLVAGRILRRFARQLSELIGTDSRDVSAQAGAVQGFTS